MEVEFFESYPIVKETIRFGGTSILYWTMLGVNFYAKLHRVLNIQFASDPPGNRDKWDKHIPDISRHSGYPFPLMQEAVYVPMLWVEHKRPGSPWRMGCGESGRIDAAGGAIRDKQTEDQGLVDLCWELLWLSFSIFCTFHLIHPYTLKVLWMIADHCLDLESWNFAKRWMIAWVPTLLLRWSPKIFAEWPGRTTWKFREGVFSVFGWVGRTGSHLFAFVARLSLGEQVLLRVGANELRRSSHWKELIAMSRSMRLTDRGIDHLVDILIWFMSIHESSLQYHFDITWFDTLMSI